MTPCSERTINAAVGDNNALKHYMNKNCFM